MKITGPVVEIFCKLDPKLEEFVTMENGKRVLYVQLDKALEHRLRGTILDFLTDTNKNFIVYGPGSP